MTYVDSGMFLLQKKLLFLTGLWPTPGDKSRLLRVVFIYVVYLCSIVSQCLWMFEFNCNLNCILYVIAILMQYGIGFVKYITFHGNIAAVQTFYTEIDLDWKSMSFDKGSVDILFKYASIANSTIMYLIAMLNVCAVIGLIFFSLEVPLRQQSLNCTKFWERPFAMDEPNLQVCRSPLYFLTGTTYMNVAIVITAESSFMVFSEHVCVMLKLAGYHLRHATVQNVYPKALLAVRVHTKALKFIKRIWNIFGLSYAVLILFGTVSASASIMSKIFSFCLFALCCMKSKTLNRLDDKRLVLLWFVYVLIMTTYGSVLTYFGQRVIDHSMGVFHDAYDSNWYEFPLAAQKFYFIIMERSIRCCSYSKRGIFVSSLEGLTMLMSRTFSYTTVFLSIQN